LEIQKVLTWAKAGRLLRFNFEKAGDIKRGEVNIMDDKNALRQIKSGKVILEVWSGFQSKKMPTSSKYPNKKSGTVKVEIGGDMVQDQTTIAKSHISALKFLVENQVKIKEKILKSLLEKYRELQTSYGYEGRDKEELMPDASRESDFKALIRLSVVHLLNVEKDGLAYVGYEFDCTWDEEHGLGIMTHKDKIIDIDGADTSFLTWIAKKDLKSTQTNKDESKTKVSEVKNSFWSRFKNKLK